MHLFNIFVLSLFLTIALVPVFKKMAFRMRIVDMPDARKVHVRPMPKTGGIAMAIGAFIPYLLWVPKNELVSAVLLSSAIIVFFGSIDDIRPLNFKQKLLPQIIAAFIVILWGGARINYIGLIGHNDLLLPGVVSVLFTLFVIIGVTNAINLSDGLDGLAGGISMLSFVMIALLAYQCDNIPVALIAIAVVGAIAGFLRYNTHPAVLFMGDAGSQLLGFLSVVFALVLTQSHTPYSRVLSLTLIGFPILDTLTVMVERLAKGNSPFKADKNHFHHRLLRLGFSHAEAVLIIYVIQACFLSFAFIFRFYAGWVHLMLFSGLSAIVLSLFYMAHKTGWQFKQNTTTNALKNRWAILVRDRSIFIRFFFGMSRLVLPLLLLFQCMTPAEIPGYAAVTAFLFAGVLAGLPYFAGTHRGAGLRFVLCMYIPLLLTMSEMNPAVWMTPLLNQLTITAYTGLVICVLMTMRLTRRQKGFKLTTMDILVFIVILVFPNLPTTHLQTFGLGTALSKALALFFSFDVLIGESRGDTTFLSSACVVTMAVLGIRFIVGI